MLRALLVLWGAAGTLANFLSGCLIDAIGNRKVIFPLLTVQVVVTALLPWAGSHLWSGAMAIAIWGGSTWGYLVPRQLRLVSTAPQIALVDMGLNNFCSYPGVAIGGVVGAFRIQFIDAHQRGSFARPWCLQLPCRRS